VIALITNFLRTKDGIWDFLNRAKDLLAQNADTVGSAIDKAGE
jgi:hypothetical protein